MTRTIRQQLLLDRADAVAVQFGVNQDQAYLRLAYSILSGESLVSLQDEDIVDGAGDKQIDVVRINEGDGDAEVLMLQVTTTESFSSNKLIQMGNGIRWFFADPASLNSLQNRDLRDKITDFRSAMTQVGPSNMRVKAYFVANGDSDSLSAEFTQELANQMSSLPQDLFAEFTLEVIGSQELVDRLNISERKPGRVDADLPIVWSASEPSYIRYSDASVQGVVCTVPGSDVAALVNGNIDKNLFDLNLRDFLGKGKAVNAAIQDTAADPAKSARFWFLNNGITVVCDRFDVVPLEENPHIKLSNLQIVNGCQTASALAQAAQEGTLQADARVLVRVYSTTDSSLASDIVITTNNQNRITSRDLKSNDQIQADLEQALRPFGFNLERKSHQYDRDTTLDPASIVTNEQVGQCYLAVYMKKPADARRRKYKIWSDYYGQVFKPTIPAKKYVAALRIGIGASEWLRASGKKDDPDDLVRKLARNGSMHLARAAGYVLNANSDHWPDTTAALDKVLLETADPAAMDKAFSAAFDILERVLRADSALASDVDNATKSSKYESDIDAVLHRL